MAFARIVVGWVVVVAIFLAGREIEVRREASPGTALVRPPVAPLLIEALLLTLLAGLWFGSLGSGGGYILFPLLGALIELPTRLRQRQGGTFPWGATVGGILRIAIPGILLGFILV